MRQTYSQLAQRQEMQRVHQGQRINVESGAKLGLRPVICWGRDWCLLFDELRHHKLISFTRERASFGISLPYLVKLGNALLSDKARVFLAEKRFAVLATINKDGMPQLSTMWYELQGDEILMNTASGRLKDRNLRRDPRVSICFENEYRYITITGTAQLIEDQETTQADIARLAIRYHGEEAGRKQATESFSKQTRVTIRIKIERVLERL